MLGHAQNVVAEVHMDMTKVCYGGRYLATKKYIAHSCPSTHPFVYSNGNNCCANPKEANSNALRALCDGGDLSLASQCCANHDAINCSQPPCMKNTGNLLNVTAPIMNGITFDYVSYIII